VARRRHPLILPPPSPHVISKALLTASGILLVAFNVFVIVRHLASATLFLCLVNSLVIGVLIPSAFVLYLYHPKTRIKAAMAEGTQSIGDGPKCQKTHN